MTIPAFAIYAATANISVPLVLTLVVWVSYHIEGIRAQGFIRYFKSWIPAGVDRRCRRPDLRDRGHLAVRADHQPLRPSLRQHPRRPPAHPVHGRRAWRCCSGVAALGWFTLPAAVAFYIFEVGLVATLQAFIFATLTAIYFGGAVRRTTSRNSGRRSRWTSTSQTSSPGQRQAADPSKGLQAIALGVGAGLGTIGPGIGVGFIFGKVIESVTRQPEMRDEITSIQWLGFALTEAIVFYAFIFGLIAFFLWMMGGALPPPSERAATSSSPRASG